MNNIAQVIGALQADVENIKERLDKQEEKLDDIHTIVTKAKGGWLVLILIGGGLTWVVQNIFPYIKKVSF
jgi:hypothetical protein